MTEGEIRRIYKSARNKKKQIPILAQLNCCSTGDILKIVHSGEARREKREMLDSTEWNPTPEQKALIEKLDEIDAKIKTLEDEYRRTAAELMNISKK